jgi:hypothetical protein
VSDTLDETQPGIRHSLRYPPTLVDPSRTGCRFFLPRQNWNFLFDEIDDLLPTGSAEILAEGVLIVVGLEVRSVHALELNPTHVFTLLGFFLTPITTEDCRH